MTAPVMTYATAPDRTRRAWDEVQVHVHALGADAGGHWVAIRLSDGGTDHIAYPSKVDATRHQLHERQCVYVCLPPFGYLSIMELHQFITLGERIYAAGGRLSDEGTHIHPSTLLH
jgi:hypothetical protein